MKNLVLDRAYAYFQRIDRRPPKWADSVLVHPDSERLERLAVRLAALRLPVDPLAGQAAQEIEVLIVAAGKDFDLLPLAAWSALNRSGHPISQMTFIVPEVDLEAARAVATSLDQAIPIEVTSEDDVIPIETRGVLRDSFGTRYGWVLQQLLCIAHVADSHSPGVLVLDADTVLLRPRVLLSGGRQILMRSLEHHDPYFSFLESLDPRFAQARGSHVTHHMLQQPDIMRRILSEVCSGDVTELAQLVCESRRGDSVSEVSIDYELYAQGLIALFPSRFEEAKWCNAIIDRASVTSHALGSLSRRYCSASLHDYV